MPKISAGCRVRLAFSLSLPDGTLVDAASEDAPLEFIVGDGSLTPGLEFALHGMQEGERGCMTIPPGLAYPLPDPDKVFVLPPEDFDPSAMPEPGQFIEFELPNGESVLGRLLEKGAGGAKVDFNHPLAGFPLSFEVHVLKVQC